jgi:hypothetical protein
MSIVYAAAASHAPGMRAWPKQAPEQQLEKIVSGWDTLRQGLEAAKPDVLVMLTSEHWANFFLDNMGAFCVGRGEHFTGPVEPWLGIDKATIAGDPELATQILNACYANGFEPGFSHEIALDHGTMVPLSYLTPDMKTRVVPIFFNTLATPRPTPARCVALGKVLGPVLRQSDRRVGVVATGGLSHDPGERNHGFIDSAFDAKFLDAMTKGDLDALSRYADADFFAAGGGTPELLAWLALAGVMARQGADTVCYEAIVPWATGIGMVNYSKAA